MFIAALVIYFKPEYAIIDPICTFVFSLIIVITTLKILKDAAEILMEATPSGLKHNMVKETFLAMDGIRELHNLRTPLVSVHAEIYLFSETVETIKNDFIPRTLK